MALAKFQVAVVPKGAEVGTEHSSLFGGEIQFSSGKRLLLIAREIEESL